MPGKSVLYFGQKMKRSKSFGEANVHRPSGKDVTVPMHTCVYVRCKNQACQGQPVVPVAFEVSDPESHPGDRIKIFPICIVGNYRALYQSWNRFTAYSIINAIPNLFITTIITVSFITCNKIDIELPIYAYIFIYSVLTLWFLTETLFKTKGIRSN